MRGSVTTPLPSTAQDPARPAAFAKPAVGFGVFAVSFSAILIRATQAPGIVVAFYRMLFSFALVIPAYALGRMKVSRYSKRQVAAAVVSGIFLGLHFATWITSVKLTSVVNSTTLVATQPFFVIAGSWLLFGEKLSLRGLIGVAVAFAAGAAMALAPGPTSEPHLVGDLLAVAGAILISVYLIIGRRLRDTMDLNVYTVVTYGSSAVTLALITALLAPSSFICSRSDLLASLAMALTCTIMGHSVFNWALKYVSAAYVSVMILGEPVGSTMWAALIFHEFPSGLQIAAAAVLLCGVYLFVSSEQRKTGERTTQGG